MNIGGIIRRANEPGGGPLWGITRAVLGIASGAYAVAVAVRNWVYDRNTAAATTLPVPVISVGNVTAGGTGKTPMVMHIAARLRERGCHPAVLLRGYQSGPANESDEALLYARRLPEVPCVVCPDRVAGARRAIDHHHADVLVLDDGFQHRRLARDLDLVLIDATVPYGYGRLLPRGLLREPLNALQRAHAIVLTRCDLVDETRLLELEHDLRARAPQACILRCRQQSTRFVALDGAPVDVTIEKAGPVMCFAAIGNPEAFRRTVQQTGLTVAAARWFPDHHAYRQADVDDLADQANRTGVETLLTTEKDAVKLSGLAAAPALPIRVLAAEVDFPVESGKLLNSLLDSALARRAAAQETTRHAGS